VASTRGEIVIAVDDGEPIGVEEPAVGERIECACEQARIPPVEQVTRDREMPGISGDDAIELLLEGDHIIVVSQVEVREMREQHRLILVALGA
jgi:hypothetical protein